MEKEKADFDLTLDMLVKNAETAKNVMLQKHELDALKNAQELLLTDLLKNL